MKLQRITFNSPIEMTKDDYITIPYALPLDPRWIGVAEVHRADGRIERHACHTESVE